MLLKIHLERLYLIEHEYNIMHVYFKFKHGFFNKKQSVIK